MEKRKSSKKGKITKDIDLDDSVSASINNQVLLIKGPQGESSRKINQHSISIKIDNKKITLESKRGTKEDKKMMGSLTAHVKNMIRGSMQNHVYTLKICSGHFPMNVSVSSNKLIVKNLLGEKVPRVLHLKHGADVKVEGDLVHVTSASKEIAGQVSADIEQLTRRPRYDTRIFQDGIYIINKDGKNLK
ncbi:50S ribosomal protein L6 [Candidatus Woesearchaeota archaeon]|nr:50S ribosomal protein L6 [Candidatus Woesearchaeota archaeon]